MALRILGDRMIRLVLLASVFVSLVLATVPGVAAQEIVKIVSQDYHIDAVDPGIKLFVRVKMAEGNGTFSNDNIVLFVHGGTYPSTPDFDLQYKDYSWADWMVRRGYVVYMFDTRNYGFSTREKAMDQPATENRPVSRSYLAVRDIGAVVDHIRAKHHVDQVTLIGWSWGAMTAGYYASLHSEKINKLVMYAPLYNFPLQPLWGAGSNLQNKRKPYEFDYSRGAYRLSANQAWWDGQIPVQDKSQYREQAVVDAFNAACLATDPTSASRNPPSLRAPNGAMEDNFMQATGRPLWSASSIYVPTLVIAGVYDTHSYPEDREGLMRDLTNAPAKKHVTIPDATHFVMFETHRFELYSEVLSFLQRK
jgi:pimeloyl-ACP methyl ester carboxylesterase